MILQNIKQLKDILKQIHEPNEYQLTLVNSTDKLYWIYELKGVKMKDLFTFLRNKRPEENRVDVFINKQFINERDYVIEYKGNDMYLKFKKSNFGYGLDSDDVIKVKGDLIKI